MLRVVAYARISQDRLVRPTDAGGSAEEPEEAGRDGAGVKRQVEDCLARVEREPTWTLVRPPYIDNDKSATKGKHRPQYHAMMAEVQSGEVDVIIAWMQSRLWRNRLERAKALEILARHRVRIVLIKGPEIDLSTAAGQLVAGVMGEMDTYDSALKTESITRAMEGRAKQGKNHGGPRRFGFTAIGQEIIPEEATILRDVAASLIKGQSMTSICRGLDAQGVKTVRDRPWHPTTLRSIMLSPSMIGRRYYRGVDVGPAGHGPIMTEETWYAVADILHKNRPFAESNTAKHLLAGIARCGSCGARMWSASTTSEGKRYSYYACVPKPAGGCRKVYRSRERVDKHVEAWLLGYLGRDDVRRHLLSVDTPGADEIARVEREIRAVENRMVEIAEELGGATDDIGRRQFQAANAKLRERYEKLLKQRVRFAEFSVFGGLVNVTDVEAYWKGLLFPKKQELIRAAVEVTIFSAERQRAWNPTLIKVVPRNPLPTNGE